MKRYFVNGFINRIAFRAPDAWELRNPNQRGRFFDTWAEAHAWLLELRESDVADCKKRLAAARRSLKRCKTMTETA